MRDAQERMLEAIVGNAQRDVDRAKHEHREALRKLREFRRAKAKAAKKDFAPPAGERT